MNTKIIETLGVESYRKGLADCLMLIQRGQDAGLSLEDSVDAAKKAVLKEVNQGGDRGCHDIPSLAT